ncbi:MAG: type II toxin-antitoxin system HicA family toxin [bacterium]|nr:type II toxin-antitoxin system HicA family toxin [bacterium]
MPNKLRVLSGTELVKFLEKSGFVAQGTHGSHAKLRRTVKERVQTLVIPLHKEVAKGTLRDIHKQVIEYLPELDVKGFFFTD